MDKLLEDANNMGELVGLNDYLNKIEIGPQKNFISTHDLELFQVPN